MSIRGDQLRAVVRQACEHAVLGPEFRSWLAEFVATEMQRPAGARPPAVDRRDGVASPGRIRIRRAAALPDQATRPHG